MGLMTVHMTDQEVAKNFSAVLAKIREGAEVIVEQDHRPVALIRSPKRSGRRLSECIASAKASGSRVTLDGGFGRDVEEGIKERQLRWNPPSWE
jgi:antitoxin (DNA-binding transcriptional repressor) of toxin-antitoxin stability system